MKFVKTQKKIILLLLLILGMIVALITAALVIYPRMSYNQNTLYGEQNENLKDFSEEEGIITAETSNPWIMLPLGRKMGVYSIILYVSDMTGENNANMTHYNMGRDIREFIANQGGTMPEDLPTPKKSLKELEKENKCELCFF